MMQPANQHQLAQMNKKIADIQTAICGEIIMLICKPVT